MSAAALALPRHAPPDARQVQRCLLLAALLHVWLVLVFGNATGTAAPGQGVWGSLTVKLLGKSGGEPGAPPGDPVKEWRDNGAPGQGTQQRQGGQVRPTETATSTETGAAALGRWNPQEVPPEAARADEVSPAPPSTATLTLPENFRPVEREEIAVPPRRIAPAESTVTPLRPADVARPTQALPLQTLAPELPAAVGRLEARPDTAVVPLPAANLRPTARTAELPPLPTELPAPVQRLEATPPTTGPAPALPRPSNLRLAPAPSTTAAPSAELPSPVRRLEAPTETGVATPLPRPTELRSTSPGTATQPVPSAALPAPVRRLEAPAVDGASVTPLSRASDLRAPSAAAATATLPSAQDLPAQVRRLESADAAAGVTPMQPAQNPSTSLAAPGATALPELSRALPGQVAAPAGPAQGDPRANPYTAPNASAGSPDAGSRLGPDLAVPPSAAASAPRAPLNLSLPRGGDIAARRGPGLIDVLPQPPERKSKLEQSIEEAANKDCRKAYANTGILAAIPLAIDTARGKGCKW